ncbi:hypothetical protein PENTCL1PPCAC_15900, partial [Pristionchus entomophagus]
MAPDRPISDAGITAICSTIGVISLGVNVFCLVSLLHLRLIYARNIFVILLLLQAFYLVQNFHFTLLYVPFMYMPVSGGYCIGLLCQQGRFPFVAHHSLCIFLIVNLSVLFIILLFFRHQNLMCALSRFKLGRCASRVVPALLVSGINTLPIRYSIRSYLLFAPVDQERLLRKLCPSCDWIERHRNFGVQDSNDVMVNGCIILISVFVYSTIGFAISGHICRVITQYRCHSLSYGSRVKIRQTLQSLVQTGSFTVFLAMPILIFMAVQFHQFEDDSVVLLPSIFLFSLNSLAHSSLLIVNTAPMMERARR